MIKFLPSRLALIGGLLWYLISPLGRIDALIFIALVPIFMLGHSNRSYLSLLKDGFWMQIFFCIGQFFWIPEALTNLWNSPLWLSILIFLGLSSINQIPTVVAPAITRLLTQLKLGPADYVLVPGAFTLLEIIVPKYLNDTYGHAFIHYPNLLSHIGFPGGTFLLTAVIIFGNYLVYKMWTTKGKVAGLALFVGFFALSKLLPAQLPKTLPTRPLEVVAVNFNIPLSQFSTKADIVAVVELIFQTLEKIPDETLSPRVVVLPESIYPFSLSEDREEPMKSWNARLREIVLRRNLHLIIGTRTQEPEAALNTIAYLRPENGVVVIDSISKKILFPFGEYIPLSNYFPALERHIPINLRYRPSDEPPKIFRIHGFKVGIANCYESIFPSHTRSLGSVDLMLNPASDLFFPVGQPELAFDLMTYNSAENRVPFIRIANSGAGGFSLNGAIQDFRYSESRVDLRVYHLSL